jgi:outer membrane protease
MGLFALFGPLLLFPYVSVQAATDDANALQASFRAGLGYERGQASCELGNFKNGAPPSSRLTWPTDVALIHGDARISDSVLEGRLLVVRSLTKHAGVVDDVDYDGFGTQESIRSESQASLALWSTDISLLCWLHSWRKPSTSSVGAGTGYTYRNMSWQARQLHQWDPASPVGSDIYNPGLVATYEAGFHMPYLQLVGRHSRSSWAMEGRIGYSPYLVLEDRDDHVSREILSHTHARGDGFRLEVQSQWRIAGRCFLIANASGLDLRAQGAQHSRQYGSGDPQVRWSEDKKIRYSEIAAQLGVLYLLP